MYYRVDSIAVCGDVIPFYDAGEFKLFYVCDYRDVETHGEGFVWRLVTSKDLVSYEECGEVLRRGNKDDPDMNVFNGCCIKVGNEYMIIYSGHNPYLRAKGLPEQCLLRAKSKDLIHWEKDKKFKYFAPDWLEMHDYRDPFVYYDENKKKYCMLIAAKIKGDAPASCKGATIIAYSDDLEHWEVSHEPFFAPHAFYTHECPDLFKMGDWWYLVFSEFSDKFVTRYRMSRSPYGPWIKPKVDTFDGHAFYAAKSVSDGKRRIMFGWNCIKNEEKDHMPWQWGGTLIPHELVQESDGSLWVRCPVELCKSYKKPVELGKGMEFGNIEKEKNGFIVGGEGRNILLFGEMPECGKFEATFTVDDDIGEFGFYLRSDDRADNYYAVRFEPIFNRMIMDMQPRADAIRYAEVETERYCPIIPGKENKIMMIFEGSILEVYINDRIAMSSRMFDHKKGRLGIFALDTRLYCKDIKLFE